jgi:hypothetical protein
MGKIAVLSPLGNLRKIDLGSRDSARRDIWGDQVLLGERGCLLIHADRGYIDACR